MLFRGPAFYVIHSTNQQFPGSAGNYSTSLLSLHKAQPVPMPGTLHYLINFLFSGVAATRRQKNFQKKRWREIWRQNFVPYDLRLLPIMSNGICVESLSLSRQIWREFQTFYFSLSLYTQNLVTGDSGSIHRSGLDPTRRILFIVHGYLEHGNKKWIKVRFRIRSSLLWRYIHFAACAYNACVYYIPLVWLYVENGGGGPHLRQHQCYCGRLG